MVTKTYFVSVRLFVVRLHRQRRRRTVKTQWPCIQCYLIPVLHSVSFFCCSAACMHVIQTVSCSLCLLFLCAEKAYLVRAHSFNSVVGLTTFFSSLGPMSREIILMLRFKRLAYALTSILAFYLNIRRHSNELDALCIRKTFCFFFFFSFYISKSSFRFATACVFILFSLCTRTQKPLSFACHVLFL